jgi:ferritin-like metal-binding protein YciE
MPETTARELKLIQYLNEAYGKEKQLETVLQAQIKIIQKDTIKKRLQEHLKETKAQARGLERRIKQLGGKAEAQNLPGPDFVADAVGAGTSLFNKAMAAAKGPIQAARGTSPADNQLRNMRDAYWNEAEEIAHYLVIESVAEELGDKDTVKLAKEYRRQEEKVQTFLEREIPKLVREVVKTDVPKDQRRPAGSSSRSSSRSSSSRSSRSSGTRSRSTSSRSSRSSASKSRAASGSSRSASSKSRSSSGSSSGNSRSGSGSGSRAGSSGSSGSGSSGSSSS